MINGYSTRYNVPLDPKHDTFCPICLPLEGEETLFTTHIEVGFHFTYNPDVVESCQYFKITPT